MNGRILYGLMVPVLLIALLIPLAGMSSSTGNCVSSSPGVIDLRGCQNRDQGVWKLDGQWEFYWQELLVPGDFESPDGGSASAIRYMEVPSQWPMFVQREGVGRLGYATYRVRLLLPEKRHDYSLKVTNIRSSSRLFVDGKLLGSSGSPGNSAASTEAGNNPYQVSFSGDGGEAELVIQTANYTYWSSGISESIYLGDPVDINGLTKRNETYDIAIMSSMAIMALYFLGQGLQRNPNRAFLYLALLCAAGAVYLATHSEKLLYDYIPSLSYEWFTRIQGVSTVAGQLALAGYTYHLMPTRYSSFVFRYMAFFACLFSILCLAVDVRTYSLLVPLTLIHTITVSLSGLLAMIRTIIARMPGSAYLFLAMLSLVAFIVVLTANMGWEKPVYAHPPIAFPVFLLCLGLYLSAQANHAYWTIRKLSEELNQKDKDKDEFLHRTSHELRTPLQAIAHISRAMTDGFGGRLNDRHKEDAALIEQTANRLSILVNDIVDYERMKSGIIHLDLKTIQLARFIDVVLEVIQHLNLSGRVQLYNGVDPHLLATADENRLTQIMFSLVENALKHTEEGSVTISAEEISGRIFITVADTGDGISDEKMNMLFRDYEQLAPHQRTGTNGLGLPFSRLLVQLHGGELRVQSEPGSGSRFTFSISGSTANARSLESSVYPLGSAKEIAVSMEQVDFPSDETGGACQDHADDSAPSGRSYRILIIDDYVNARALMNVLAVEGYETVCARNGEEAMALLGDGGTFDL
ncbi:ATP-binding protein [Paenibacillus mendelii]|nr:ATP-binding protein [Paenibacillus mendelii]